MEDNGQIPPEIEQEFLKSWDAYERFFRRVETPFPHVKWPIVGLIEELRNRGHDRHFRAGQSLMRLLLSRAKKHGLRPTQPCVMIYVAEKGIAAKYFEVTENMRQKHTQNPELFPLQIELDAEILLKKVSVTEELEAMLERLKAHPID